MDGKATTVGDHTPSTVWGWGGLVLEPLPQGCRGLVQLLEGPRRTWRRLREMIQT